MNRTLWTFGLAFCLCGCRAPRPTRPPTQAAKTVRSGPVILSLDASGPAEDIVMYGTPVKGPDETFYRWSITNANYLRLSFAGQTLQVAAFRWPAMVSVTFRHGPSEGQVTAHLQAGGEASSSQTSVNISTRETNLSKLVEGTPGQREIPPGTPIVIGRGIGAFPSLYLEVKP